MGLASSRAALKRSVPAGLPRKLLRSSSASSISRNAGLIRENHAEVADLIAEGGGDEPFLKSKVLTARFFAEHVLAKASSYSAAATRGAESVLAVEEHLDRPEALSIVVDQQNADAAER